MPNQNERNQAQQQALRALRDPDMALFGQTFYFHTGIQRESEMYWFAKNSLEALADQDKETLLNTLHGENQLLFKGLILADYLYQKCINGSNLTPQDIQNYYHNNVTPLELSNKLRGLCLAFHDTKVYLETNFIPAATKIVRDNECAEQQHSQAFIAAIKAGEKFIDDNKLSNAYQARADQPYQLVLDNQDQPSKITVKKNQDVYLVCHQGKKGPPEDLRKNKQVTGNDAQAMVNLGHQVLWIVRKYCTNGIFNHRLKALADNDPETDFWTWFEGRRVGSAKYRCVTPAIELKWRWNKGETLWEQLRLQQANDQQSPHFLRDLAAYGMATYLNEGGVCAQLSHFTMGLLTLLAPAGTFISLVYHKIDHSFVVIAKGNSSWFVVDPWVADPYVCPWQYSAFMERKYHDLKFDNKKTGNNNEETSVGSNFTIEVKKPVEVPYGVAFTQEQITRANQKATQTVQTIKDRIGDKNDIENQAHFQWIKNTALVDDVWGLTQSLFRSATGSSDNNVVLKEKAILREVDNWSENNPKNRHLVADIGEWSLDADAIEQNILSMRNERQSLQTKLNQLQGMMPWFEAPQNAVAQPLSLSLSRAAAFSKAEARKVQPTRYEANSHTGNRLLDLERSLNKR